MERIGLYARRAQIFILCCGLLTTAALCQVTQDHLDSGPRLIVRFRSDAAARAATMKFVSAGTVRESHLLSGLRVIPTLVQQSIVQALAQLRVQPDVLYAEPNYIRHIYGGAADPRLSEQWNLAGADGAAFFAGIHATDAWAITTGDPSIVIALVDTGVDIHHPDLAANIYRNASDCDVDGVDSDQNGFADDCYGQNAITGHGDAIDDNGHGTAMAGIIGAVGNNGVGIAGVNWNVKILPCKALDANGQGTDADIIACFEYVASMKDRGANVVALTAAFGGADHSQALEEAIAALRARGILVIAAAGNNGFDNSMSPVYPASYAAPNVIAVADTTNKGVLAARSNFGATTVHVAAPGEPILTTGIGGSYVLVSGTSGAAAHIAGMAALISAAHPSDDWKQIRNRILTGGDVSPETAATITQCHANVVGSITCAGATLFAPLLPSRSNVIASLDRGVVFSALHLNCDQPAGVPTVSISPGNVTLALPDDGTPPDDEPGDGTYSALWIPPSAGQYSFHFSNGYTGTIYVAPYQWTEEATSYRALDSAPVTYVTSRTVVHLSFPVSFAENAWSTVIFDPRGFVTFDANATVSQHDVLPTQRAQTLIAPFWTELVTRSSTAMRWAVLSSAPERELVLEWVDMGHQDCNAAQGIRFQVVFSESSADVLFNYATVSVGGDCSAHDNGATASVGVQISPDVAAMYAHDAPLLHDNMTLRWRANLPPSPAPVVTMLQPDNWAIDDSPVAVLVRGSGFTPGSVITWNGSPRTTDYISQNEIYTVADATDLVTPAMHTIAVFNALPGGGASAPATFSVGAQDFTLQASQQTVSIASAQPPLLSLTIEPAPVFRAPISLSCTGLPRGMQCTFSPSTVTPGTAPVAVAVTISCTTQCAKAPHRAGFALQLATFALIAIVALPAKERAGTHVLPFAAMCVLTLCSCGGGSASGGAVTDPTTKTSVTAPVVITATSGAISHSQTVTLIYTK